MITKIKTESLMHDNVHKTFVGHLDTEIDWIDNNRIILISERTGNTLLFLYQNRLYDHLVEKHFWQYTAYSNIKELQAYKLILYR
jgi:hypothetical protein